MAELQPDMLEKVRKLAELIRTQDNRITANPVFMVQSEVRRGRWENVQPFLTEEGAKAYLRADGHNLKNPRIYVAGGKRNAEWEFLRELVLALGEPGPRRTNVDIPASEGLDPIHLVLTDHGPGRGELTATCFGSSWTAYWGGMGDRDVAAFVASVGSDYLAGKLGGSRSEEYMLRISQAIIDHLRSRKAVSNG